MSDRLDFLYAPAPNKSQLLRNLAEYQLAIERDVTVAFDLCVKVFFYNADQVDAKPEKWFRLHLDSSPILHASIDVFPRDSGEYIIHLSKGLIFALDDCVTTIIGDPRFFCG